MSLCRIISLPMQYYCSTAICIHTVQPYRPKQSSSLNCKSQVLSDARLTNSWSKKTCQTKSFQTNCTHKQTFQRSVILRRNLPRYVTLSQKPEVLETQSVKMRWKDEESFWEVWAEYQEQERCNFYVKTHILSFSNAVWLNWTNSFILISVYAPSSRPSSTS